MAMFFLPRLLLLFHLHISAAQEPARDPWSQVKHHDFTLTTLHGFICPAAKVRAFISKFELDSHLARAVMIVVHHLGVSQSERIVWLCEELGITYKLVKHTRDPLLSPESLKNLPGNITGKSPFIEDTDAGITLSESPAICDYIIYRYGDGRLALKPDDPHFADYLYWFHFANSSQQATLVVSMFLQLSEVSQDVVAKQFADERTRKVLEQTDDRLKDNKWLAGPEFTAADVMSVYGLTTQRYFGPQVSLAPYKNILRWLQDCAARDGYKRALEVGDPDMKPLLGAEPPHKSFFDDGGMGLQNDHWKK